MKRRSNGNDDLRHNEAASKDPPAQSLMNKSSSSSSKNTSDSRLSTSSSTSSSTGFQSFFRWFKKTEKEGRQPKKKGKTANDERHQGIVAVASGSSDKPPQNDGALSSSSSCDSVFSTATNGFAFINPVNYNPHGPGDVADLFINPCSETDTYRQRRTAVERQQNTTLTDHQSSILALKKKYGLYGTSETLHSENTLPTRSSLPGPSTEPLAVPATPYSDLSLPTASLQNVQLRTPSAGPGIQSVSQCDLIQSPLVSPTIANRRTWSDCSIGGANKKPHVPGKRPAPAPPSSSSQSSLNRPGGSSTYSSLARSTLKKRRAPPPPYFPSTSVSHEVLPLKSRSNRDSGSEFLNQIDETVTSNSNPEMDHIRYFTNQQSGPPLNTTQVSTQLQINTTNGPLGPQTGFLAQRNSSNLQLDVAKEDVRLSPRLSPTSPRPWYKRPVSGSREPTAIPFKREVILRTVDKRKKKKIAGDGDPHPETGFMRSSRFGIFSRNKEANKNKVEVTEEVKRRSGIGMPNISELDRQAQQIISSQRITLTDEVVLRQRDLISDSEEDEEDHTRANRTMFQQLPAARRRKSAKELISRFEARNSRNATRPTVPGLVMDRFSIECNSELPTQVIKTSKPSAVTEAAAEAPVSLDEMAPNYIQPDVVNSTAQDDQLSSRSSVKENQPCGAPNKNHAMWKCAYCTLENPNWRILCEVCERIKPFENRSGIGLIPNVIATADNKSESLNGPNDKDDLDKKMERVRKYMPQSFQSNTLSKSASETSVGGNLMTSNMFKKSLKESQNFNEIRSVVHQFSSSDLRGNTFQNEVVVNSVTVIQDPGWSQSKDRKKTNLNGTPDLEEVRHARLNHFKPHQPLSRDSSVPVMITDKDSLDRERERLKEKIRAMNAKALSERYPVAVKRQVSLEETYDTVYPKVTPKPQEQQQQEGKRLSPDRSAGAIKKSFKPQQAENVILGPELVNEDEKEASKLLDQNQEDSYATELAERKETTLILSDKTGTIAINKLIKSLQSAILDGQDETAAKLAKDLAKMKVNLSVTRQKKESKMVPTEEEHDPNLIGIQLLIEDDGKVTKDPVQIQLNPGMTVGQLKEKIKLDFNHPIKMQKFIFNNSLLNEDQKSLKDYGMSSSGDNPLMKLFILGLLPLARESSPKKINSKYYLAEADQFSDDENLPETAQEQDRSDDDEEEEEEKGAMALPPAIVAASSKWTCPLCTLINGPDKLTCGACSKTKPLEFRIHDDNKKTPIQLKKFSVTGNNLSRPTASHRGLVNDFNIRALAKETDHFNPPPPVIVGAAVKLAEDPGFLSKVIGNPNITRNRYRGVDNYNPKNFPKSCSPVRSSQIPVKRSSTPKSPKVNLKNQLHMDLVVLNNNKDVVENTEGFECPICFGDCLPGNGVVLRDCLHSFCRECLSSTVEHSEDAQIKCPFMDSSYSCDSVLQEREIRAVVTEHLYEKHLMKSVREAENNIENAFHCKTPNCRGWCIYEDNVNMFKCPVCSLTNCLTCQAIHDGLNCKQYQDQMENASETNEDARRTKAMLEDMVKDGEAMNCPTCQVIVMKKWGCDWLKCSMCKTEICWVTRGPRWGPAGKGDISGGCKCGVFGKKCHAKCTYCH